MRRTVAHHGHAPSAGQPLAFTCFHTTCKLKLFVRSLQPNPQVRATYAYKPTPQALSRIPHPISAAWRDTAPVSRNHHTPCLTSSTFLHPTQNERNFDGHGVALHLELMLLG